MIIFSLMWDYKIGVFLFLLVEVLVIEKKYDNFIYWCDFFFFFSEYFYDVLFYCGIGGCVKVMSNVIRNKLVNYEWGNMFLVGLVMVVNFIKEIIEYVLELCEENFGRIVMLIFGMFIYKVCESKL